MKRQTASMLAALLVLPCIGFTQESEPNEDAGGLDEAELLAPAEDLLTADEPALPGFAEASQNVRSGLEDSIEELSALREQVLAEQRPLNQELRQLEAELADLRREYAKTTTLLQSRTLDLSNLGRTLDAQRETSIYLSNLLSEYTRNFEARLHISELQRYDEVLETARLAPENTNLTESEIYVAQAALLDTSLDRLEDALGGSRFEGQAVDSEGLVRNGTFVLLGPAALFSADDGGEVGTAEQRLGSLEPTVLPFADPEITGRARAVVEGSGNQFPLDPTLGNAHKIAATQESFLEHVEKGGAVMIPIFAMAGAALLVAIYKWLSMALIRKPSRKRLAALMGAVERGDEAAAMTEAKGMKGPVAEMLQSGVRHIREPRALIEEVMYEHVLTVRMKLQRMLPFIAICAASAPLLGLLGTVTGIINTFKLITVFGSGDVKTLSGGISEALITTKFGLIVAIPSLLLHAFLSRKARGLVGQMETAGVSFVNRVAKSFTPDSKGEPPIMSPPLDAALMKEQVREAVADMLGPIVDQTVDQKIGAKAAPQPQ